MRDSLLEEAGTQSGRQTVMLSSSHQTQMVGGTLSIVGHLLQCRAVPVQKRDGHRIELCLKTMEVLGELRPKMLGSPAAVDDGPDRIKRVRCLGISRNSLSRRGQGFPPNS